MNVNGLIEQLNILNQNYLWIIKEGELILKQITAAIDIGDMNKVNKLRDQFIELENRHLRDKITYNRLIKESREYFRKKYGIDLFKYFELEDI